MEACVEHAYLLEDQGTWSWLYVGRFERANERIRLMLYVACNIIR